MKNSNESRSVFCSTFMAAPATAEVLEFTSSPWTCASGLRALTTSSGDSEASRARAVGVNDWTRTRESSAASSLVW